MKIKVSFTSANTHYSGYLDSVSGAGSNTTFHLTIDGYHFGRFWYAANGEWRFDSNTDQWIEEHIDLFERAVIAAMEDV